VRAGFRLDRVICPPATGTLTTRQPRLAVAAAASSGQVRYQATVTAKATVIDDALRDTFPVSLGSSSLYHRSQPDAGTDNVMTTTYILRA
jgi:hypothetical protein